MSIARPLTFIYYFFIIDTLVSHSEELYWTYIFGIQRTDTSHLRTEDWDMSAYIIFIITIIN